MVDVGIVSLPFQTHIQRIAADRITRYQRERMSNILHYAFEHDRPASGPRARSTLAPMVFGSLDEDCRQFLLDRSNRFHFAAGQLIQQRGETAQGAWLIEKGAVMLGQFFRDGEFRAIVLLGEGDSYGELALLAGEGRALDAVARRDSQLRLIPASAFDTLFAKRPEALRTILRVLAQQLQEMVGLVAGIRSGSSLARTASLLANLAQGASEQNRIEITQQELAELLGITRATANKALRALERDGVIRRRYGSIEILDPMRLTLVNFG